MVFQLRRKKHNGVQDIAGPVLHGRVDQVELLEERDGGGLHLSGHLEMRADLDNLAAEEGEILLLLVKRDKLDTAA